MQIRKVRSGYQVEGDTFLVKDILKRRGGRWDSFAAAWIFTDRKAADAAVEEAKGTLAMRQELAELEAL